MSPSTMLRTGAGAAVQAAAAAALAAALEECAVFDAPPVRGALPFAVVDEPVTSDWRAAGLDGRELRLTVSIQDAGERPVRLRALLAAAEAALGALAGGVGDGWQVAGVSLIRSRIAKAGERWRAGAEWRVRVARNREDGQ